MPVTSQANETVKLSAAQIAAQLKDRAQSVLRHLLPAGKTVGHEYQVGSLQGEAGASLKVHLNGKGNVWSDFATGDTGGDLLDLWAAVRCGGSLKEAMREAQDWLGISGRTARRQAAREQTKTNHRGTPAGSWVYCAEKGDPWLEVRRYNLPDGAKKFLYYDHKVDKWVSSGGHQLPDPRPLYNLPAVLKADDVILFVEGEKCAEALTQLGFTATTTLGGALAPHKTDFRPLANKYVMIWPDHDKAGTAYADEVAKQCRTIGAIPHLVPIADDKPEKWDAADAIADGWTREHVLDLLSTATLMEEKKRLRSVSLGEFLALNIKPREMLLAPVIASQSVSMIHAPRGVGKTFLALGIGLAIADGGMCLTWSAPKARRVLYVDGELPGGLLQERLAPMQRVLSPAVIQNFRLITPDLQSEPIPDLSTEAGQGFIEQHLEDIELLILDNLSTLMNSGEENAAESWQPIQDWLLRLRRQGISTLLLHHSSRSGTQRGTSKREDILDTSLKLVLPSDYESKDGCRFELYFDKWRGDPRGNEPIEAKYEVSNGRAVWTFKKCTDALTDKVAALLNDGLTQRQVAQELGISLGAVNKYKQKADRGGKRTP